MTPSIKVIRSHSKRSHDGRVGSPVTRNTRSVFLVCASLYLSIYHLRGQDLFHLLNDTRDPAAEWVKDAPSVPTELLTNAQTEPSNTEVSSLNPSRSSAKDYTALLRTYLPEYDPVLADYKPSTKRPVQVHFWTGSSLENFSPTNFLIEGVERSQYLKLVHISFLEPNNIIKFAEVHSDRDRKVPLIWMVDLWGLGHDCDALETLLVHSQQIDKKRRHKPLLLLIDYSGSSEPQIRCPKIHKLLSGKRDDTKGIKLLRIARRGIVHDRLWDPDLNWVQLGHILPNSGSEVSGGNILYSPYPVREVVVTELTRLLEAARVEQKSETLHVVDTKRSNDIAFFGRKGDNGHYANLRLQVATTVTALHGISSGSRKLRTIVRFFGDFTLMGSTIVFARYVEEMMGAKVVVVAQRDEWEDHYRLMESLAAGALVFTDVMIGLPAGLIHKKNIIVYDSTDSLRELLLFYLDPVNDEERLTIAKKGSEFVMGHHRCWHRVEELIFGTAKTAVDAAYNTPPPRRAPETSKRGKKNDFVLIEVPTEKIGASNVENTFTQINSN